MGLCGAQVMREIRGNDPKQGGRVTVGDATPRPPAVSRALLLLAVSWATSVTLLARRLLVSPPLYGEQQPARPTALFLIAVVVAVGGGLLAALAHRRRWAYFAWLGLFALSVFSILSTVPGADEGFAAAPASSVAFLLALGAQVGGVVLLLRRPSRLWYGIDRPPTPPGQWRADPGGRHQYRYWEDGAWSEQVADDGVVAVDPLTEADDGPPPTRAHDATPETPDAYFEGGRRVPSQD